MSTYGEVIPMQLVEYIQGMLRRMRADIEYLAQRVGIFIMNHPWILRVGLYVWMLAVIRETMDKISQVGEIFLTTQYVLAFGPILSIGIIIVGTYDVARSLVEEIVGGKMNGWTRGGL